MPPRQKVIILKLNLMGDLIDDDGNRYNEAFQRIDYLGRVIPEPEEEPTTSSPSNGGAGAFQPQTLADYNRPDLFYPRRAAIQVDMDCLDEEPPKQDFQFQNRGVQSRGWYDALFKFRKLRFTKTASMGNSILMRGKRSWMQFIILQGTQRSPLNLCRSTWTCVLTDARCFRAKFLLWVCRSTRSCVSIDTTPCSTKPAFSRAQMKKMLRMLSFSKQRSVCRSILLFMSIDRDVRTRKPRKLRGHCRSTTPVMSIDRVL